MAKEKLKTVYVCTNCGEVYYKWQGQCASCKQWNTLVEDVINENPSSAKGALSGISHSVDYDELCDIDADDSKNRIKPALTNLTGF